MAKGKKKTGAAKKPSPRPPERGGPVNPWTPRQKKAMAKGVTKKLIKKKTTRKRATSHKPEIVRPTLLANLTTGGGSAASLAPENLQINDPSGGPVVPDTPK